ncbi:uncharacterized protein H6S33_009729 [Morchella sextelata]|uniref:uncharacterized protein n=1 Tax=Morchella sextelata TaxID=1174677 RepID=UPI001D0537BF|nr:uncharacterized protein H6S33_009729 [Morchella sextelata]KAH0613349.1 hypothetical protein H6S33_009729 [Morchella sextelata]
MTSTRPHSPVLTIPTLLPLLLLLLLHTHPALGLPSTRRDFYGTSGNPKAATAGISLSVIALVLSIVAFGLMLYNRRMRAQDERYARAQELRAVEGDAKRGYPGVPGTG